MPIRLLTIAITVVASALCFAAGFAVLSILPRLANSEAGMRTVLVVAVCAAIVALVLRRRRRREPEAEPRGWSPDMRISLKDGTWRTPDAPPNAGGRSGPDPQ